MINHRGEIVSFCVTKGSRDDCRVVEQLTKNLKGLAAADKGYLDKKLAAELKKRDLKLITKLRNNMKNKMFSAFETFFLH